MFPDEYVALDDVCPTIVMEKTIIKRPESVIFAFIVKLLLVNDLKSTKRLKQLYNLKNSLTFNF